jgi:hypothetical protein
VQYGEEGGGTYGVHCGMIFFGVKNKDESGTLASLMIFKFGLEFGYSRLCYKALRGGRQRCIELQPRWVAPNRE